jgi:hypothetical protein
LFYSVSKYHLTNKAGIQCPDPSHGDKTPVKHLFHLENISLEGAMPETVALYFYLFIFLRLFRKAGAQSGCQAILLRREFQVKFFRQPAVY